MKLQSLLRRRKMPLAVFMVVVLFALAGQFGLLDGGSGSNPAQPGTYHVTRFVDGDTIVVDMNGRNETVRMIGIDTPETHKPNTPVQCYGPAASARTKSLIGDQSVRLEADPKNQNRDRYDRLLRYVYLPDGTLIAQRLIEEGYGFAYTQFPFEKKQAFMGAEEKAKMVGKGLWGNCEVIVQGNGRKQTNNTN